MILTDDIINDTIIKNLMGCQNGKYGLNLSRRERIKGETPGSLCRIDSGKGTEGFRADYKNTSRREIPPEEDPAGDGGYNRGKSLEHSQI